jgi:hypothetical protein
LIDVPCHEFPLEDEKHRSMTAMERGALGPLLAVRRQDVPMDLEEFTASFQLAKN